MYINSSPDFALSSINLFEHDKNCWGLTMTPNDSITFLTRALLRQYNISPRTNHIFKKFLTLENVSTKSLDLSSDSTQNAGNSYLRAILFRLRRDELVKLLPQQDLHGIDLDKLIFLNWDDPCFGIGVNDYMTDKVESRIKFYHFYHQSHQKINVHQHIETICGQCGISPSWLAKDFDLLSDIRTSCTDLYFNGSFGLKIYSQFFLTKDLFGKYREVFNASALNNYKKLFNSGYLPKIGQFCIRYYGGSRSVRVDFMCNTRRILPYLDAFDLNGSAMRLCQNIANIKKNVKLSFISIDFNKKPKTHFYFKIWNGELITPT